MDLRTRFEVLDALEPRYVDKNSPGEDALLEAIDP